MFVRLASLFFFAAAAASPGLAAAQENQAPFGTWITAKGESHIEIFQCGEAACGRIAWMEDELGDDGRPLTDINNPDPARRNNPVLGLVIMTELQPTEGQKRWAGKVYNPRNGKTYDVNLIVQSESEMVIEGCLWRVLCQQQEWQRVESQ
jgi:uncharacterized protein (DUF2147 family)